MDTTIRTDDGLAEALENTRLGDEHQEPEHLLFRPRENSGLPGAALDNVPRYLFRVASPNSDGETDENWVRSESAKENCPSSREDIFSELSDSKRGDVAQILNLHLRWSVKCEWVRWFKDGKLEDNFMSWTSSLLFALQYIYYRHLGARDESSLDEIKLYVIDTTRFPRGTFLRDLDLIHAFHQFDYPPERNLTALQSLRNSGYYFGEYLSQGSLKIANKCQVVPGARFFDDSRLCRLQPDFNKLNSLAPTNGKLEWAKEVRRLRICIWGGPGLPLLSSAELCNRLQAIEEIVRDVAPDWKYPLAVNLAALMGVETVTADHDTANDNVFFEYFRSEFFNDKQRRHGPPHPSNFKIIGSDTMPELKQVEKLVREVHKHFKLKWALDLVQAAEVILNELHRPTVDVGEEHALAAADPNQGLARAGQALSSKLRTVQQLCREIDVAISADDA